MDLSEDFDVSGGELDFDIWMNEPFRSVGERREAFLSKMCIGEMYPVEDKSLERMTACSGAALNASEALLPASGVEEEEEEESVICRVEREASTEADYESEDVKIDRKIIMPMNYVRLARVMSHSSSESSYEGSSEGRVKLSKNWIDDKKRVVKWWKSLSGKWRSESGSESDFEATDSSGTSKMEKVRVKIRNKSVRELSAVYTGQHIQAHCGTIRTMKFSADGQYLASGGEDGVVRIWLVTFVDGPSSKHSITRSNFGDDLRQGKYDYRKKKSRYATVVIPDKTIHIEESPMHEFHGHSGEILDLAWSKSNVLLSASTDKTVRRWQVGCNDCIDVFHHSDYVTCVQFNPADDRYFISGSVDGKVRTWRVSRGRVVDWVDVRDIVTAICYQPHGRGFVVGSISGNCRFYCSAGKRTQLEVEVHVNGGHRNRITGIEFCQEDTQRVMVTSEDSKVRILDGVDIVHQYRGLANSRRDVSSSNGKHVISVREDSHVYVWNYNYTNTLPSAKTTLSSCEHFLCKGVTVAVPWSGKPVEQKELEEQSSLKRQTHLDTASFFRDLVPPPGISRFSMDSPRAKKSATWPAEQLPSSDSSIEEDHNHRHTHTHTHTHHQQDHFPTARPMHQAASASPLTWGLVIVTASHDGTIRTFYGTIRIFHNYGLPMKL